VASAATHENEKNFMHNQIERKLLKNRGCDLDVTDEILKDIQDFVTPFGLEASMLNVRLVITSINTVIGEVVQ
jgi:hypothetical protein